MSQGKDIQHGRKNLLSLLQAILTLVLVVVEMLGMPMAMSEAAAQVPQPKKRQIPPRGSSNRWESSISSCWEKLLMAQQEAQCQWWKQAGQVWEAALVSDRVVAVMVECKLIFQDREEEFRRCRSSLSKYF